MKKIIDYRILILILLAITAVATTTYIAKYHTPYGKQDLHYVTVVGEITESSRMEDGSFAYSIKYNITDQDEPITQHIFNIKHQPIVGQKILLRYDIQEPILFELLEEIRFLRK